MESDRKSDKKKDILKIYIIHCWKFIFSPTGDWYVKHINKEKNILEDNNNDSNEEEPLSTNLRGENKKLRKMIRKMVRKLHDRGEKQTATIERMNAEFTKLRADNSALWTQNEEILKGIAKIQK